MGTNKKNPGGGSGGDTGMDSGGNQIKSASGTYQIGGNQVILVSRGSLPPAKAGPSRIILLAAGSLTGGFIDDGSVDIRGVKGVRITSGPIAVPLLSPDVSVDSTNGIELIVGETQNITLRRGLLPADPFIQMKPDGITVHAGALGKLTLSAGANSITIGPDGILISGLPLTRINPGAPGALVIPPPPDKPLPPKPPKLPKKSKKP